VDPKEVQVIAQKYQNYEIIRYLFYRKSLYKRMHLGFIKGTNYHVHRRKANRNLYVDYNPPSYFDAAFDKVLVDLTEDECDCDMIVELQDAEFYQHRVFKAVRQGRTVKMMYDEIIQNIFQTWQMRDHKIEHIKYRALSSQTEFTIGNSKPQNQRDIPEYYQYRSLPKEHPMYYSGKVAKMYKEYDLKYFHSFGIQKDVAHYKAKVWKSIKNNSGEVLSAGLPWTQVKDGNAPGKLRDICLQRMSWHNRTFTGNEHGRYVHNSHENLYPDKVPLLINKYDKPTHTINEKFKSISHLIPEALKMMYEYMDVTRHFKKFRWTLTDLKNKLDEVRLPIRTSSGIRPGPRFVDDVDGVEVTVSVNGKKLEQMDFVKAEWNKTIDSILAGGEPDHPFPCYQIAVKGEVFVVDALQLDHLVKMEILKFSTKARVFYIAHEGAVVLAALLHKERMLLERGKLIKIGMKFIFGGAKILPCSLGMTMVKWFGMMLISPD